MADVIFKQGTWIALESGRLGMVFAFESSTNTYILQHGAAGPFTRAHMSLVRLATKEEIAYLEGREKTKH